MRTAVKRIISIMLCISMLAGLIVVGDASDDRTLADTPSMSEKNQNKAYVGDYPSTSLKSDKSKNLGTGKNPFVVLEIVPTLDQASIGYLIPGCEPIDMAAAETDMENSRGVLEPLKTYEIKNGNHYYHLDTFIKNVFNSSSYGDNPFISRVVTITPEFLKDHMDLIEDSDMIYVHTGDNTSDLRSRLWYPYNRDESERTKSAGELEGFDKHDLTNDEVIRIMNAMASPDSPALVMEGSKLGNTSGDTLNTYKLMLMATQFKPSEFVDTLGLLDKITTESAGKEKLSYPAKDSSMSDTWVPTRISEGPTGTFAFDASGNDITDKMRFDGQRTDQYSVFEKIFIYNGNHGLVQDYFDVGDIPNNGGDPKNGGSTLQDMVTYYGSFKTTYSIQDVMKYILGKNSTTQTLRVLEIQPCQQFIYRSDANWKTYYAQLCPWFTTAEGSEDWVEDEDLLQVTTMTTAEFIGSTGRYEYGKLDENGNPILLTTDSSDDLIAKYDMIIIGSIQDASNGKNGYNDPNLGKLVYTSVGDLVYKYSNNFSSKKLTNVKRDRMRYSGTDITLKKMLELEDFLKAGKPIVADKGLYTSDDKVDTAKVDKNSKLYDLLTWEDKDTTRKAQKNILRYGSYEPETMKELLGGSECKLVFVDDQDSYPLEYSYTENNSKSVCKGVIANENYQAKDVNGKAVLTYHFYIKGDDNSKYQLRLALDSDGDGVYRGSLKEHSEVKNMKEALGQDFDETTDYDTLELPLQMEIEQVVDGKRVPLTTEEGGECLLSANTEYYASYTLPDDRLGIVPWKLEVNDADNEYLRSSAIDYTAFQKTGNKAQINVLQMRLSQGGRDNWSDQNQKKATIFTTLSVDIGSQTCYDPAYDYTSTDHDNTTRLTSGYMNNNQKTTANKFKTYLEAVQEFDVHIQYLFNSDWNKLFGSNAKRNGKKLSEEERIADWEDFLSQYDMVVLGFQDENCFTNNKVYATGINNYISQGKSMILSHDTVEGANASYNYYNQYAPWIRSIAGQRRAYYNKQNDGTYEKSYLTTYINGKVIDDDSETYNKNHNTIDWVAAGNWSGFIHPDLRNDTSTWGHVFSKETDFIDPDNPDLNASPVEEKFLGTFVKENLDNSAQLYANYFIDNWGDKTDRIARTGRLTEWPKTNAGTSVVKITNNGQITSYPYKINSFITVANTHCQNYQLDMDYEAGGDVNVWFNLTDKYDEELKQLIDEGKVSEAVKSEYNNPRLSLLRTGIYSAKNQDSRNNFYIYNKGNITYTGSGHGIEGYIMPDDEVKLFVNTMISAYRPPEATPYASFDNASSVASNGDSLLYVDYDADAVGDNLVDNNIVDYKGTKCVKVEFSIQDSGSHNGITNQTYYMTVYKGDNTDPEKRDQLWIEPIGGEWSLDPVAGSDTEYIVEAGKAYALYIPYSEVVDNQAVKYRYSTYMKYLKEKRNSSTPTSTTTITTMILPLFDLN
ncbi:MAG: DUF5057 domain-containing protein [Lachnospiraceae bacterium]|nr:DUF5057 domain-containing protein [Lachnospiraceae bacterium]